MPVDWNETVCVAHLADDPSFGDEMEELERELEEEPRHAILDMATVTFVNSSNLAQLVGLRKLLSETGCRVALCAVKDELWRAFELSRLDKLFSRYESVPLALAAVQIEGRPAT